MGAMHTRCSRPRPRRALLGTVLAFGLVAAACGSSTKSSSSSAPGTTTGAGASSSAPGAAATTTPATTAASTPAKQVELHWALASAPDTLFAPTYFNSPIGSGLMGLVQDNLLRYTGDGNLVPNLATGWKSTDPTTYVYTVRTGAMFSDGTPVTPADVKFSIDLQSDPAVASKESALFENVKAVTVAGNDVTVTLKTPDSLWKFLPSHMGTYIYSEKDVKANLSSYGTPQHLPLGSGPYMVSEFVADSHVTMVPNPHYWGDPPKFSKIRFDIIPDDQTRLLALQNGQIDGTFDVPSASIAQWSKAATVNAAPSYVFRGLTLDMTQAPFNDIHVRRALYYATDRKGIAEGLFPGQAQAANTLNTPSVFGTILSAADVKAGYDKIATFDYDIDKAKAELALSTVPTGFETTINVPDGSSAAKLITQAIKESWSKIGVKVTLNLMPGGPRFQIILDHKPNLGVQIIGNTPDVPDPVQLPELYFDSAAAAANGNNSSNFRDPAVDKLLTEARQSSDPVAAAKSALAIEQAAAEQIPIIPILWSDQKFALRKDWASDPMNGFSIANDFVLALKPR